jgi:hypothetical protein
MQPLLNLLGYLITKHYSTIIEQERGQGCASKAIVCKYYKVRYENEKNLSDQFFYKL